MPIANIILTSYPLTSLNRSLEKATVTMFHEEDLRLDIEDFKISVVHNGADHYVGTKLVQNNFKDGILAYSNYLQEVQVIGDLFLQCTKDKTVTSIISKCNNIVKLAETEFFIDWNTCIDRIGSGCLPGTVDTATTLTKGSMEDRSSWPFCSPGESWLAEL